jgi:hypothetical protein
MFADVSDDYRLSIERLKELKGFADQLYMFFTKEVARDPCWKILAGSRSGIECSLNRLRPAHRMRPACQPPPIRDQKTESRHSR